MLIEFCQHWILRLPNFLKIDAKPFNPDTYEGPEEELAKGSRESDMLVKLRVENTVRWRWTKDAEGRDVRAISLSSTPPGLTVPPFLP